MRDSAFFRFTALAAGVSVLLTIFLCFLHFLPAQRALLERGLMDKASAVARLAAAPASRALAAGDDLTLISLAEHLMKLEDVGSVYIVDRGRTVLFHRQLGERGKVYHDGATAAAAVSRDPFWQRDGRGGFLYSFPLSATETLCIGFSGKRIDGQYALLRRNACYTAGIAAVLVTALFMFAVLPRIRTRFLRFEDALRCIGSGIGVRMNVEGRDEFSRLALAVNGMIERFERERSEVQRQAVDERDHATLLVRELAARSAEGIVIVDADNRVLYANERARTFIPSGNGDPAGRHVADVIPAGELLSLLQRSYAQADRPASATVDGRPVQALTLAGQDGKPAGTVIIIEPQD